MFDLIHSMTDFIMQLVPIVDSLGIYLYFIVMGVALLESTPIIGTFTPGTLMLLFFGFLISVSDTHLILAIAAAVIGAALGDCLGYLLGRYGSRFFKEHKGLLRIGHIEMGKAFFAKHGGKSIFIGRFVGPVRPIVPLVAGAVRMSMCRFLPLNFSAAFVWAGLLISIGYFAGNEWQHAERIVTDISIAGLFVLAFLLFKFVRNMKKQEVKEKVIVQ